MVGLPEQRCPECGRGFDLANPSTFTVRTPFVRWRYWMPGFVLALGGGLSVFAFAVVTSGFSWATTLILPVCIGALLGYGARVRPFVLALLILPLIAGLVGGLIGMNMASLFCSMILAAIAMVPILLGTLGGFILRQILKQTSFDQRWHLPSILLLLIPLAAALVDRWTWRPPPVESVRTTREIALPVDAAWRNVRFYEQVPGEAPALFRWRWLGLPRPLRVTGTAGAAGDRTVCVYDKGRLVKEAIEVSGAPDGSRRLGFRVVEQGFELHAMRLVGGSFQLDPAGANRTRVTLETTYVPHMAPRWCWRPFERWTVGTLHGHVLHAMGDASATLARDGEAGTSAGTNSDVASQPEASAVITWNDPSEFSSHEETAEAVHRAGAARVALPDQDRRQGRALLVDKRRALHPTGAAASAVANVPESNHAAFANVVADHIRKPFTARGDPPDRRRKGALPPDMRDPSATADGPP